MYTPSHFDLENAVPGTVLQVLCEPSCMGFSVSSAGQAQLV